MKTVIYCFSGTGNNLAAAKQLAEALGNTDILPVTSLLKSKKISNEYDMVGFVSPSYYSHIPPIVQKSMTGLTFAENQKIFTVIGSGVNRGHAVEDMRQLVEESGRQVSYELYVIYPEGYIMYYDLPPQWLVHTVIKKTYKKIGRFAKILKSGGEPVRLKKALLYNPKNEEMLQKSVRELSEKGKRLKADNECVLCESCVKVCPLHNIKIEDGTVKFGDSCQQCMACVQYCPKKAIDLDGAAKNKKRYRHPMITMDELIRLNNKS